MAKTKSKKFHKIKIHHNRWLIWAIAYILFVAIAMVGYLKVSDILTDSENSAQNVFLASHSYTAPMLGFSVRYPAEWSIEANSANSVSFLPADGVDAGVTVTVAAPSAEKAIRKALKISTESPIMLDGVSAEKISSDLGGGYFETVVIATYNNKLYIIQGSDNFVEKILSTFHFTSNVK